VIVFKTRFHYPNRAIWQSVCLGLSIIAACALLLGCNPESDPELISSIFLEKAEKAFADRSPRSLRELISKDYLDTQQRDAKEISAIGTGYIMRSRSIYLFTDLESAVFSGAQIHATVLAAFAARPVSNRSLLPRMDADLYWFEIVLTKESGDWKLLQSSWRQAMLEDVVSD
jgi:hypothetical protein